MRKVVWCARNGLSPRMRGNRSPGRTLLAPEPSIPAYAGEPSVHAPITMESEVYPRVCEGTPAAQYSGNTAPRLSPRMRGNRQRRHRRRHPRRSIPAYAGEPHDSDIQPLPGWVYPRVCGGTPSSKAAAGKEKRLSPRMRGNPGRSTPAAAPAASIPAYAGEPRSVNSGSSAGGVYPRVCGGTNQGRLAINQLRRLSPRMRGNRRRAGGARIRHASIPAYAGEPLRRSIAAILRPVYPRVCGGTTVIVGLLYTAGRLSPRMRGNPVHESGAAECGRSIPAYVGEPPATFPCTTPTTVYPRVCGGTNGIVI